MLNYSHAIVGKYIRIGSKIWSKHNKYKTLESAKQALYDMTKDIENPAFEYKIVPYFKGLFHSEEF